MAWKLLYHPSAVKQTKKLHKLDQKKLVKSLRSLKVDPQSKTLDTTKLVKTKSRYRFRLGKIRVIYEKDSKSKIIYIWKISYRKDAYRI